MSCHELLGWIMFIVCLSVWDCSFVSFAKFGTLAAMASSDELLVPLALSFLKLFGTPTHKCCILCYCPTGTRACSCLAFTVCFLSVVSDGVNSYFSLLASIIFTLCYLHSNNNPMRFLFLFYMFSCLYFPFVSFL